MSLLREALGKELRLSPTGKPMDRVIALIRDHLESDEAEDRAYKAWRKNGWKAALLAALSEDKPWETPNEPA